MREQLHSFAADSDRPNIILRVLPIPALHLVSAESFVIFSFGPQGKAILHHVVATESLKASFYIENQQETYLFGMSGCSVPVRTYRQASWAPRLSALRYRSWHRS